MMVVLPYRSSAEPEPEILWSGRVARLIRRRSTALVGTIGASVGGTALAVALGVPAVGGVCFVLFLGAAAMAAGRSWAFDRGMDLRVERIGAAHRLRVTGSGTAVDAPFALAGSSRLDEGGYLIMRLDVRGKNGRRTTIGAIAEPLEAVAPRDEWFDGAPLGQNADAGEYILDPPHQLTRLREVLESLAAPPLPSAHL
jgi:hypothetical protein